MPPIDLRSDTVTRPTAAMREAMAAAEVGDDVIDVDPTVLRLQQTTAELLGKEAAIFMPSGTMTNQVAVRLHCSPGQEMLCEADCHIYNYEQGAFAQLSGVVARTIPGRFGVLKLADLEGKIRSNNEHLVQTRLVALENTHNHGGGTIQPQDEVVRICDWAHSHNLVTHLDGARLFNASAASGRSLAELAAPFDTVSVCFSKGLGAPVGSALAGPKQLMQTARRHRKLFGGGMRQSGVIAAGALYALENHFDRLAEDHAHAQILAEAITTSDSLSLSPPQVETNIVIFEVAARLGGAAKFVAALEKNGVRTLPFGPTRVRAVTHLDVDQTQVRSAAETIVGTAEQLAAG